MRKLVMLTAALALAAGCSETSLPPTVTVPNYDDAELDRDLVVDVHGQVGIPAVDVLWVVDNSRSMAEEQRALTNNFASFMSFFEDSEYDLDYHIGVVTTGFDDPDERGALRTSRDHRDDRIQWIDRDVRNADAAFREMAKAGIDGPFEEKGRAQVYSALEILGETENSGFIRDDAYLSVIVLSDEDDASGTTPVDRDGFVDWLAALKGSPDRVSFSSIVGPEGGCGNANEGSDYLAVTDALGGITHDICEPSWANVMEDLGLSSAGLRREFALSQLPADYRDIQVTVKAQRQEPVEYTIGLNLGYVPSRNTVEFLDEIPPPESKITVRYVARTF